MHKKKEVVQDVTLHDLDAANARPQVPDLAACSAAHSAGRTRVWLQAAAAKWRT